LAELKTSVQFDLICMMSDNDSLHVVPTDRITEHCKVKVFFC